MEQVLEFMEVYWGVTIFGGLTVGTLITFIVLQIRAFIRERTKNITINTLMDSVVNLLANKDEEAYKQAVLLAENEYLRASQALTFKYLNYITVASKMDGAQKIALVEEAKSLQDDYKAKLVEIAEGVFEEVTEEVMETLKENQNPVIDTIIEATEEAGSLLDKYSKEEG